jgi:adenylosuccinate synthase
MPTELQDKVGELIREKAHEYGTTTGRPRRCGWFDAVAGRFSVQVNGFSDIALTHLDVYDDFPSIKICTAYRFDNNVLDSFPSDTAILEKCQPVYEELPGWQVATSEIRDFAQLPLEAHQYVARLEELLSCPVSCIAVGPKRKQLVEVRSILP